MPSLFLFWIYRLNDIFFVVVVQTADYIDNVGD